MRRRDFLAGILVAATALAGVVQATPSPRLTFRYGEERIDSARIAKMVRMQDGRRQECFVLPGNVSVTVESVRHGEAVEWVSWFENKGKTKSPHIAELYDADFECYLPPDEYPARPSDVAQGAQTIIYSHKGSMCRADDFAAEVNDCCNRLSTAALPSRSGWPFDGLAHRRYAPNGGRSSDGVFPFFNVNRGDEGFIVAVGWTGQWNAWFDRATNGVIRVRSGIEAVDFSLDPGERIRTSSVAVMPYHKGYVAGQNDFRRLVREHYSLVGRPGRSKRGYHSMVLWGGVPSDKLVRRIDFSSRERLGFDAAWVDAAWYGTFDTPSPDEFVGKWWGEAGDWRANPNFHPDGLKDVSAAAKRGGMKFILWFEIERAVEKSQVQREHPEWFLGQLLNLGKDGAWQWAFDTIAEKVRTLGIDCYRQDFNMAPLAAWRAADAPDRKGLTEIRHIIGLYRLLDALLKEFPNLMIDNCASGGRRIDIETVRRSLPLSRSDYQCPANHDPDVTQNQMLCFSRWLPYSGALQGHVIGDTYRARSSYSFATENAALCYLYDTTDRYTPEKVAWQRKISAEFARVREVMDGDFYPLVEMTTSVDKSGWCAYRFERPDLHRGCVLAFRREKSPLVEAEFPFANVDTSAAYVFDDADGAPEVRVSGANLAERGLTVRINQRRQSRLLFYAYK